MFTDSERVAIEQRFWPKVAKLPHSCWEWRATTNHAGYGLFVIRYGKNRLAHRVSFALRHGPSALIAGKHIAHLCHNRLCVNPDHLVQVTAGENVAQSRLAGRTARGTRYKSAKLNDDAVREIRKRAFDLDGECDMMKKYRVSQIVIKSVFQRRAWKHVV